MAEIDTFDSLFFLFWKNICLFYERWGRSMSIIVLHHLFLRKYSPLFLNVSNVFSGREVCGQVSSSPGHCLDGIMLLNQFIRIPD